MNSFHLSTRFVMMAMPVLPLRICKVSCESIIHTGGMVRLVGVEPETFNYELDSPLPSKSNNSQTRLSIESSFNYL